MDNKIMNMTKNITIKTKQIVKKLTGNIQDKYNKSSENYWLRGRITSRGMWI